ncbi:pentapeptide repeat-containing protein [Micromonospora cremea]|uniref:pentapeptide repeat-containing protein n=1 Tax=Micromonospora cremea TaxID=709881 RepID=UPI0013566F86|nr:pentapeptide repeat-containing protein [Micromonospora cremea]
MLLLAFALVVGPWLLTRHPQNGLTAEQALKAKNDVRTTLVQALAGLAVAGGLAVTYGTYRQNQRDQADRRTEQDRLYQLSQAEQADRRAEQDRAHQLNLATHVNDLYTKAVEQLGHTQAPVRLGALYSLVQLAQANPEHRQTVVNVLCAYLRMPYSRPEDLPEPATPAEQRDASQELQVRLTAQRLLAEHLRAPGGVSGEEAQDKPPSPDEPFWPGMNLDLTGAALIDFSLMRASVASAIFERTTFSGRGGFDGTTFTGLAWFRGATFSGRAWFFGANFSGDASFVDARFDGEALFHRAIFASDVKFDKAIISGNAIFDKVIFGGDARFHATTFGGKAASFREATFSGDTSFADVRFDGDARFHSATFIAHAWFTGVTFAQAASFWKATFDDAQSFGHARVLHLDDPGLNEGGEEGRRVWPDGWTVRPDAKDPTHGTLALSSEGVGV